jgi:hypothetical protein
MSVDCAGPRVRAIASLDHADENGASAIGRAAVEKALDAYSARLRHQQLCVE